MRFPSQDEINAAQAAQELEERRRFLASRQAPPPRVDEAAMELRLMKIAPPEWLSVPGKTGVVDCSREPLPPLAPGPPEPKKLPTAYVCGWCGKVFDKKTHKTKGAAAIARNRHQKACPMKAVETAGV